MQESFLHGLARTLAGGLEIIEKNTSDPWFLNNLRSAQSLTISTLSSRVKENESFVGELANQTGRQAISSSDVYLLRGLLLSLNVEWIDFSFIQNEDASIQCAKVKYRPIEHVDPCYGTLLDKDLLEHIARRINPELYHSVDIAWNVFYDNCELLAMTKEKSHGWDRSLIWTYPSYWSLHPDELSMPASQVVRRRRNEQPS